jgi:LCP family protein required for cell wall assembly
VSPPPEPPHQKARYWRVPPRRRTWVGVAAFSLWILVGLVVAITLGGYIYLDDALEASAPDTPEAKAAREAVRPQLPGKPANILLIGSDTRPAEGDPGRSDSLILVRMDPKNDFISMLSFPRDLYVPIPGMGMNKINAAYSQGPAKTIETVSELTGEDVNGYVIIDFSGFAKLVDAVGGVYLDIDRRYYNKNVGTAATNYADIDLQAGYQKLDGADALSYVRYRHTDSDYDRIARQQQFLSELKRQTKQLGNLTNITTFRTIYGKNIETSITNVPRFLSLLELALTVPKDRIARVSVQGQSDMINGASVELAAEGEIATKVAEWKDPEFEQATTAAKPIDPSAVDVTVYNGSGHALAAEDVAQALSEKRYRASVGGNAPDFDYASSAVYYGPGFREPARKIAALLGPTTSIGALSEGSANGNEVVVMAGANFTGTLATPPKAATRPPADTVDTAGVVPAMREIQRSVGFPVMAPLKVARGSAVKIVRADKVVQSGGGSSPRMVKVVFNVNPGGVARYWSITMTNMKNPPIVGGETGSYESGGRRYLTYYDGRNLQRLAFQKNGVWYWVSNTLKNDLSAKTIEEIAKAMRPLNRAKLAKGTTNTPISVETEGSTP